MHANPRFSMRAAATKCLRIRSGFLRRGHTQLRYASSSLRIVAINDVYELHALPSLRTLIDQRRAEQADSGGAFLCTLAGDFVSPSTLSGMDAGRGMVAVLNMLPISHACFGNHEADLKLDELVQRTREFGGTWLNSNLPEFPCADSTVPYDVVEVDAVRVGVIGLVTSERGVFRKNQFRGLAIEDTVDAAKHWSTVLRREHDADVVIALTHQSIAADEALATSGHVDLVLGGHEHEVILRTPSTGWIRGAPIVKAGSDATTPALVDVTFDTGSESAADGEASAGGSSGQHAAAPAAAASAVASSGRSSAVRIADVSIVLEDVTAYPAEATVAAAVDEQLSVLRALERETVLALDDLHTPAFQPWREQCHAIQGGRVLSSVGTRFRQTTVGALITSACKEVLQVDVAAINGGSIKGSMLYESGSLTYLELQKELPFPTKMVTLHLPGSVLDAAVAHSRGGEASVEKRGYLQLDAGVVVVEEAAEATGDGPSPSQQRARIVSVDGEPFDPLREYSIALPRNLLKGIFDIQPLVAYATEHPEAVGEDDAYIPALNLVLMHRAKRIWTNLGDFDALDLNGDGELDRDEIISGLRMRLGEEPSEVLIENVISAIDTDRSGSISREEFDARAAAPPLRTPVVPTTTS